MEMGGPLRNLVAQHSTFAVNAVAEYFMLRHALVATWIKPCIHPRHFSIAVTHQSLSGRCAVDTHVYTHVCAQAGPAAAAEDEGHHGAAEFAA